jgi:glycosyltransferase involved in cell wall biosynthesis
MIVRNEAGCIARCLESVRPIISYWVICDTGSTDRTKEIVRQCLQGLPGELHQDRWRDFSHNRNLGLRRARGKADYHLMLDADFTVDIQPDWNAAPLEADGYRLAFSGDIHFKVARLVSDRHEWRYRGRAHEHLHSPTARTFHDLPGLTLSHHADGGSRPGRLEKYRDLLLEDHAERPDDPRTIFYLGQTAMDLARYEEAIEWHQKRISLGGWPEEQWYAAYMMNRSKELAGRPWPEVLHGYLECFEMRPSRLEPLQRICEYHRRINHYALNYALTTPILNTPYPAEDVIFIERPVYQYGLLMERALAAFWLEKESEAKDLLKTLLAIPTLPADYHRIATEHLRALL